MEINNKKKLQLNNKGCQLFIYVDFTFTCILLFIFILEKELAKDNVQALQIEIKELKDVITNNKSHIDNLEKQLNLQKEAENTLQEQEAAFDQKLKKGVHILKLYSCCFLKTKKTLKTKNLAL